MSDTCTDYWQSVRIGEYCPLDDCEGLADSDYGLRYFALPYECVVRPIECRQHGAEYIFPCLELVVSGRDETDGLIVHLVKRSE